MHGDRIVAVIHTEKERESAEPEELIEQVPDALCGKVQGKKWPPVHRAGSSVAERRYLPRRASVQHQFKRR